MAANWSVAKAKMLIPTLQNGGLGVEAQKAHQAINAMSPHLSGLRCFMCKRRTGKVSCHACSITGPYIPSLCLTCFEGLASFLGYGTVHPYKLNVRVQKVRAKLTKLASAKHNNKAVQARYRARVLRIRRLQKAGKFDQAIKVWRRGLR
jgi:hypothetical protein